MGLSGRKVKQRIGADPRNLSWADDAARFGSNYLSKFGWDASKGLGAGGDGMKSHIKVSHKLDMLGIGAAQTKDPNGIAWKQNRDFENLLRRLNENLQDVVPAEDEAQDGSSEDKSNVEAGEKKKEKRKRKDTEDEDRAERKRKKKEAKEKKGDALTAQVDSMQLSEVVETKSVSIEVQKVVSLPRHRAHRARAIAAKNIASKSSAHISEILGVAPDPQTVVAEAKVQGKLTSVTDTDALGMDKITTSTKSLADYFKEKLTARNGGISSGTSTPTSSSATDEDAYERPRGGIGASRMHLEIQSETRIEEETQRVGLSKFSSLMSSSFLAATSSMSTFVPPQPQAEAGDEDEGVARISEVESDSETEKKHKKEKKRSKGDGVERGEKKSKKDKKGKGKAADEVEEALVEDEDEKKLSKKEKKEMKEISTVSMDTTEDNAEKIVRTKEKRKHKEKSEDYTPDYEEAAKSKKEKKKRRTDS